MWKKIFAASAVAVGIAGLLGGGSAFASTQLHPNYVSGQNISMYSGNVDVCVYKTGGYSGDSIIADIRGTNYQKQIVFGDFADNSSCVLVKDLPIDAELKYVTSMGINNLMYMETIEDDHQTLGLFLDDATTVNKYLRSSGQTATRVGKSSATINFDANGGTGTLPVITGATVGSNVTLPKSTLTRTGYNFAGWNTEADGTGTAYADEATISITEVGQIQLFAQWQGRAVLDYGANVNIKLKKLAGTNATDTSTQDSSIKAIKKAEALPAGFDTTNANNIISANVSTSPEPIYAWFDNSDSNNDGVGDGAIYLYTSAGRIEGGANMSSMFYGATSLADISALSSWDTSSVTHMSSMFNGATSLADISALSSWNTSSVTDMSYMFYGAFSLADISALSSWNTSSVTNMSGMFGYYTKIVNTDALETKQYAGKDYISWDTSSVTNMGNMFYYATSLADISALSSWDTSSVTDMSRMFNGATSLADISALSSWNTSSVTNMSGMFSYTKIVNTDALETKQYAGKDYISWDTSSVTDMSYMFYGAFSLADISALSSWNTSSVTNMSGMFGYYTKIVNTDALETKQYAGKDYISWDTSSVTNMGNMFYYATSLADISALSSWDTSSVTDMSGMFSNVPARPLPSWYHE